MFVIPGEKVRHLKRGTTYLVVSREYSEHEKNEDSCSANQAWCAKTGSRANVQGSWETGIEVVFYRSLTDLRLWARPVAEFEDGRFEYIEEVSRRAIIRTEALQEAMDAVGNMRQSEAGLFDAKHSGQRGQDRSDALYDAYREIRKLI